MMEGKKNAYLRRLSFCLAYLNDIQGVVQEQQGATISTGDNFGIDDLDEILSDIERWYEQVIAHAGTPGE